MLIGLVQSIYIAISLSKIKNSNTNANKFLMVFIVLIGIGLISRIFFNVQYLYINIPSVIFICDVVLIAFGPLLYFYTNKLLFSKVYNPKEYFLHFSIAIIEFVLFLPFMILNKNELLRRLSEGDFWTFPWWQGFVLIYLLIYMGFIFYTLLKFKKDEKQIRVKETNINFLIYITLIVTIALIAWLFGYITLLLNYKTFLTFFGYNFTWVILSYLTFYLGYKAIHNPQIFRIEPEIIKYSNSNLSKNEFDEIKENLEKLIIEEKLFLDNSLSIISLSEKLKVPVKDLSRVINEHYKMNFFDFINQFKINEFLKIATKENLSNKTILALAFEAGFKSKTTFYKSFKKMKNVSPTKYLKIRLS